MKTRRNELFESSKRTRSISRVLLVFVLAITLVVGSVPMMAQEVQAASVVISDNTFTLTDDGVLTIKSNAFRFEGSNYDFSYWYSAGGYRGDVRTIKFTKNVTNIKATMTSSYEKGVNDSSREGESFYNCTKVIIENGVTSIGDYAFTHYRNLKTISIPKTVDSIGQYAFHCCEKLQTVSIPGNVDSIGPYTFNSCDSLEKVTLPSTVKSIDDYAFGGCPFVSLTLPSGLKTLGEGAFYNCYNLKSISIPNNVSIIEAYTFDSCSALQTVTLPSKLTRIYKEAFQHCGNLTSITFPAGLSEIGDRAFEKCTRLKTITFKGKTIPENIERTAFNYVNGAKGYYPYGSDTDTLNSLKEKFTGRQNESDYWGNANILWVNSVKTSIAKATVTGITNKTYTGKAITQSPTVKVGSKTLKNGTDYTLSYKNNVKVGTATVTITGKGSYTGSVSKTFKINPAATSIKANSITVGSVGNKTWTGSPIKPKVTVKNGSTTLKEGTDYTLSYKNNTAVGTATITITGKGKYKDTRTVNFKIVAPAKQIERVEGKNRYLTSTAIADELKAANGNKKFTTIIVATGLSYPDALSGGYLAKVKNAPIILTGPSKESETIRYIKNNLASNGRVYILGGDKAVPASFVTMLRNAGITNYKRLGGSSRFETNLIILNEAGVKKGDEIVVAKGYGSEQTDAQDALIAGATGKPMLLANINELTQTQRSFLNSKRPKAITVIGTTGTVSSKISGQLSSYGSISRIAGTNIYERSILVAQRYYKAPKCIVLAIGDNWPDALTGGPLAIKKGGPLVLTGTAQSQYKYAKNYVKKVGIYKNYTLGGTAAVPEATTREIMKR